MGTFRDPLWVRFLLFFTKKQSATNSLKKVPPRSQNEAQMGPILGANGAKNRTQTGPKIDVLALGASGTHCGSIFAEI